MQPEAEIVWSKELKIHPSLTPMFPGLPPWIQDSVGWLLSLLEETSPTAVSKIREIGLRFRRIWR
jgi:hypothetical protein